MRSNQLRYAPGHVLVTAAFIGSLALVLAAGLHALGLTDRVDAAIAGLLCRTLQQDGAAGFPKALPPWALWLGTAIIAYGLALTLLGVPGTWRRLVLWLTTLVWVAAWAPVLGLAAHAPEISASLVAALWSGACALVYVHSHRMPCDEGPVT
ncbi:MAG: hypothetical protein WCP45_02295 [Verrucomicrobiota bacterium]